MNFTSLKSSWLKMDLHLSLIVLLAVDCQKSSLTALRDMTDTTVWLIRDLFVACFAALAFAFGFVKCVKQFCHA